MQKCSPQILGQPTRCDKMILAENSVYGVESKGSCPYPGNKIEQFICIGVGAGWGCRGRLPQ